MTRMIRGAAFGLGFLAAAGSASATQHAIPTPMPGEFADTQSSVNVPLLDWPSLGRTVKIELTASLTPSNAVWIALGHDANGDEDLEPEETALVMGVDCAAPFVREEVPVLKTPVEVAMADSTSGLRRVVFSFKGPREVANRFDFAKVTTSGRDATNAEITADVTRKGLTVSLH